MTHANILNSRTDGMIHRREVAISGHKRALNRQGADKIWDVEKRSVINGIIDAMHLEIEILKNAKRYNALDQMIENLVYNPFQEKVAVGNMFCTLKQVVDAIRIEAGQLKDSI